MDGHSIRKYSIIEIEDSSIIEQVVFSLNATIRRCTFNARVKRRSNDGTSRLAWPFIPGSFVFVSLHHHHSLSSLDISFYGIWWRIDASSIDGDATGREKEEEEKKKKTQKNKQKKDSRKLGNSTPTLTTLVVADRPDRTINFWSGDRHWKLRGFHPSQGVLALDLPRRCHDRLYQANLALSLSPTDKRARPWNIAIIGSSTCPWQSINLHIDCHPFYSLRKENLTDSRESRNLEIVREDY